MSTTLLYLDSFITHYRELQEGRDVGSYNIVYGDPQDAILRYIAYEYKAQRLAGIAGILPADIHAACILEGYL